MAVQAHLNGIKIGVKDMNASLNFYQGILGIEPIRRIDSRDTPEMEQFLAKMMGVPELHFHETIFSPMDTKVKIQPMHFETPATRPGPRDYDWLNIGSVRLVFAVNDTNSTYEELKKKGVKFLAPPQNRPAPRGGGNVQGVDPDGVPINFTSSQATHVSGNKHARLNGVKIAVGDMAASVRFYSEIMGLPAPEVKDFPEDQELSRFLAKMMNVPALHFREAIFSPKEPAVMIQLMEYVTPKAKPRPKDFTYTDIGSVRLVFHVQDANAAYKELKSKGIKFVAPPSGRVTGSFNVIAWDPDGIAINISDKRYGPSNVGEV